MNTMSKDGSRRSDANRTTLFRTLLVTAALAVCVPAAGFAQSVDELVARNTAARGGAAAWQAVSALELRGRMDIGQGVNVPYVLQQKRPSKMRLELEFDEAVAVQTYDGSEGWKLRPFLNRNDAEPMSSAELSAAADTSDLYGLLFDYAARGHTVKLLGHELVDGQDTFKLEVTLPGGSVRWVYLDAQSALEVKVEAMRRLGRSDRLVETYYYDWQATDGLLIARRLETRTEGKNGAAHPFTVQTVRVNPSLDDSRFSRPSRVPTLAQNGE
jgi:hypothetical protein